GHEPVCLVVANGDERDSAGHRPGVLPFPGPRVVAAAPGAGLEGAPGAGQAFQFHYVARVAALPDARGAGAGVVLFAGRGCVCSVAVGFVMGIDVVYALPDRAWQRIVTVEPGATAAEVLAASGFTEFADMAGAPIQLGVFGRKVGHDHVMQCGERLELYRP